MKWLMRKRIGQRESWMSTRSNWKSCLKTCLVLTARSVKVLLTWKESPRKLPWKLQEPSFVDRYSKMTRLKLMISYTKKIKWIIIELMGRSRHLSLALPEMVKKPLLPSKGQLIQCKSDRKSKNTKNRHSLTWWTVFWRLTLFSSNKPSLLRMKKKRAVLSTIAQVEDNICVSAVWTALPIEDLTSDWLWI